MSALRLQFERFNLKLILYRADRAILNEATAEVRWATPDSGRCCSLSLRGIEGGLRPDLLFKRRGRTAVVGDTKWKRLEPDRNGYLIPNREDVYQMHAYAAAYQCERLALIYPWHDGMTGARESVLELPPMGVLRPRLNVVCIDVRDGRFDTVVGAAGLLSTEPRVAWTSSESRFGSPAHLPAPWSKEQ